MGVGPALLIFIPGRLGNIHTIQNYFVCMLWAIHLNLATVLVGSGMCHRPGGLWEVPPSWWALEGATVLVVSGRRHRPGGLWQVPPSWWALAIRL